MANQVVNNDALAYCLGKLRREDRDRYLPLLFAPRTARSGLVAIYAFNLECARRSSGRGTTPVGSDAPTMVARLSGRAGQRSIAAGCPSLAVYPLPAYPSCVGVAGAAVGSGERFDQLGILNTG